MRFAPLSLFRTLMHQILRSHSSTRIAPERRAKGTIHTVMVASAGVICAVFLISLGMVLWHLETLRQNPKLSEQTLSPRLHAAHRLSSDLSTLAVLSLHLASRETKTEIATIFADISSYIDASAHHIDTLQALGMQGQHLVPSSDLQDTISRAARTIHAVVVQRSAYQRDLVDLAHPVPPSSQSNRDQTLGLLPTVIADLDRQLSRLVSEQSRAVIALSDVMTALLDVIHADHQATLAQQALVVQNIQINIAISAVVGGSIFLTIFVVLRHRLLVPVRQLDQAAASWKSGLSITHLPATKNEFSRIGDALLQMSDQVLYGGPKTEAEKETKTTAIDTLSGLATRSAFFDCASTLIEGDSGGETPNAVWMFLAQSDPVRALRDHQHLQAWEQMLAHIGTVMRSHCGPTGHVGRLSTDEFALVRNDLDPQAAQALYDHLLTALNACYARLDMPYAVALRAGAGHLSAAFSLGLAQCRAPFASIEHLYGRADTDLMHRRMQNRQIS